MIADLPCKQTYPVATLTTMYPQAKGRETAKYSRDKMRKMVTSSCKRFNFNVYYSFGHKLGILDLI